MTEITVNETPKEKLNPVTDDPTLRYAINEDRDWNKYCKDNDKYRLSFDRRELKSQSEYYHGKTCQIIDRGPGIDMAGGGNKTQELLIVGGAFLGLLMLVVYVIKNCSTKKIPKTRNHLRIRKSPTKSRKQRASMIRYPNLLFFKDSTKLFLTFFSDF